MQCLMKVRESEDGDIHEALASCNQASSKSPPDSLKEGWADAAGVCHA
jgi:hypothetical protein